MIVKALVENTADKLACEHGLSLYIQTEDHRILFDTGASDLFATNARELGVDLEQIGIAFISHGHDDHGGGLKTFFGLNKTAKVYISQRAFGSFYSKHGSQWEYIGLDRDLVGCDRFILVDETLDIDGNLSVFSHVLGERFFPTGNQALYTSVGTSLILDDFSHEQNLVVRENGRILLVVGCAHRGIVNILESYHQRYGGFPTHVIGGFHLYNHSTGKAEEPETLDSIATYLLSTGADFHTCHCTGEVAYHHLKTRMGERMGYISTGMELRI